MKTHVDHHAIGQAIPHADQYFGVWAMYEPAFNGLVGQARQLNLQVHLSQQQTPAAQAEIQARANTQIQTTRGGAIALLEMHGPLQKHASSFSAGTSTVALRRQIRAAMADDSVAGILLHVDSPGGTVAGTDDLAQDVAAAAQKKPVYAYIEDLGASAAYYVASQATKVFANSAGLVGSIGVFSVVHDLSQMAEKEGIQVHVVKFGSFKGSGAPGTAVSEEQLAEMQKLVNSFGEDFVAAIQTGRKLPRATVEQLADGRVHKAAAAVDLKLIDAVQSLDATLTALIEATQQPSRGSRAADATRRPVMSQETETTIQANAAELKSSLPTIAQLRKAIPSASSDFLVAQLEAEATIEEAIKAHSDQLAKENEELKAQLAAASEPKPAKQLGNDTLADLDDDGDTYADAGNEFRAKVDALVDRGVPRFKAVSTVARKHPELREAMVAEANL
ncbi:MAG: signal peptide peptidase SppA [Planctomycetota bacterium]|nr:MAG: signal peptide peptidase SppA [Planctomycetota bacterium]